MLALTLPPELERALALVAARSGRPSGRIAEDATARAVEDWAIISKRSKPWRQTIPPRASATRTQCAASSSMQGSGRGWCLRAAAAARTR
jgi:hypothetical protein